MYVRFAQAIQTGNDCEPNFETAVQLHQLIDAIKQASDSGREVKLS
jgi:predicted dehydrogenase